MTHKILNIEIEDVIHIKNICRNGEENMDTIHSNPYSKRIDKKKYNTNLISSETFFCDMRNKELIDVIKKYIILNEKVEYISNIHYINYKIGEEAKEHVDRGKSIRSYVMLLNDSFEGGEFYLGKTYIPLKIGEIIEFDAKSLHSVKPITIGNREVIIIFIKTILKYQKSFL